MTRERQWPSTVEEAVTLLLRVLPDENIEELALLPHERLLETHFGLSGFVGNAFGLWSGNIALAMDCARVAASPSTHPDDVSMVIVEK